MESRPEDKHRVVPDHDRLRQLVLDGASSAPGPVADDAFFENLRNRILIGR